jgi:hypothetical protein
MFFASSMLKYSLILIFGNDANIKDELDKKLSPSDLAFFTDSRSGITNLEQAKHILSVFNYVSTTTVNNSFQSTFLYSIARTQK